MTKMFPFIVKDMKNVLIYLPQALCACGIYAVCYGLATLITGMLARRLQENGQQPTEENGGLPENGQQPTGENGGLPERATLSERLNLWLKNAGHFLGSNLFVIYLWMLVMIVFSAENRAPVWGPIFGLWEHGEQPCRITPGSLKTSFYSCHLVFYSRSGFRKRKPHGRYRSDFYAVWL